MAPRRYSNRAALSVRPRRDHFTEDYRPHRQRFESELDRDFAAMKRVWQMLRHGAVRMLGEMGRQY